MCILLLSTIVVIALMMMIKNSIRNIDQKLFGQN